MGTNEQEEEAMKSLEKRFQWVSVVSLLLVLSMLIIPFSSAFAAEKGPKITVMTRNLYLGADIFKVVEAAQENPDDPLAVPIAVAEVYNTMLYTNFWARAEAIADEIAENKPDVVGLQEVSTFYKQTPGDFLNGNPEQASFVVIDFYEVLEAALRDRDMEYKKFEVTNADVELPMLDFESETLLSDVRMVDHDMVLVRKGHAAATLIAGNYSQNLGLTLGGRYVEFTRGFLIVDVNVKAEAFRFVNTHLEVRSEPGSVFRVIQSAQMMELLYTLNSLDAKPVVMVGDFNSSPEDVPGTGYLPSGAPVDYVPPYMQAIEGGYLDAWLLQNGYDEGYTSGFGEYISNPFDELTTRIDLILTDPCGLSIDRVKCDVVGDEISDMVPNPLLPRVLRLWPSDHAGVVGKIKFNNLVKSRF